LTHETARAGADLLHGLVTQAESEIGDLKVRLSNAQALGRFLTGLSDRLDADQPSEALRHFGTGAKALATLELHDPGAHAAICSLAADIRKRVERDFRELVTSFPQAVAAVDLGLDPGSKHPTYTLLDGLIEVHFDRPTLSSRISPRDGRSTHLGIDVAEVVAHVGCQAERLTQRPFEPQSFLDRLSAAYRTACGQADVCVGDSVPIKSVLAELAKDKDFRTDEFNVDLSRLIREQHSADRAIKLENCRDPRNGLLLWQLDQQGYYGFIKVEGN
jgi:hypothetical protein